MGTFHDAGRQTSRTINTVITTIGWTPTGMTETVTTGYPKDHWRSILEDLRVSVDLLRKVAQILLNHVEDLEGSQVSLDKDFYWFIPPEHRFNPYSEPSEFALGQLRDCVEELGRIASDPDSAISYGLVWLGDLMRTIGEQTVK
jgi:hypothetical protein